MAQKRFLMFGAHPDDCDIRFGGTALKLAAAGHAVKFVSVTSGDCGHQSMEREALARRRYAETQASAAIAGLAEYQVLGHHDCEVVPDLPLREEIIRVIRKFDPDVVLSHRNIDYHADHRNTAQAVMDAAYLISVPLYLPDTPIGKRKPVFGYVYDSFTDPRPIQADAVVPIDDVIQRKFDMLNCHVSQFYEWLPWDLGVYDFDAAKMTKEEKYAWLDSHWGQRYKNCANFARERLVECFGEAGRSVRYAELFELSPYGRKVSREEFQQFFQP